LTWHIQNLLLKINIGVIVLLLWMINTNLGVIEAIIYNKRWKKTRKEHTIDINKRKYQSHCYAQFYMSYFFTTFILKSAYPLVLSLYPFLCKKLLMPHVEEGMHLLHFLKFLYYKKTRRHMCLDLNEHCPKCDTYIKTKTCNFFQDVKYTRLCHNPNIVYKNLLLVLGTPRDIIL